MAYKLPPPLTSGDTIGIMAPSSRIDPADLQAGVDALTARGYGVFVHPQSYEQFHQSAGTAEQKAAALHELVREPDIKAIFFAGGGNRALHMLDGVDYKLLKKHPKIYMGFSDNTALLNAITARSGIVTYHGPVVKRLPGNEQLDHNFAVLEGREKSIPLSGARYVREGRAKGVLFGGNLSLIRAMEESDLPITRGGILFLEEISEEFSKIDRDLCALRRSGLFNKIGGIIFGQFSDLTDTGGTPFEFTLEDIVREHTGGLNIPVIMGAPFGHERHMNYAIPIGAEVRLEGYTLLF